jgi:hypothetical protein
MRLQTQPTDVKPTASVSPDRKDDLHAEFSGDFLGDLRFRALLSEADWRRLAPVVRRRFSRRLAVGETTVYAGAVRHARLSPLGRLFVQAARLVGAPLPISADEALPVVVGVTEDGASGGQIWTLIYARRSGFPQVIHSAKTFSGPTGLEECLRFGIRIALSVTVEDGALVFRSGDYFWRAGRLAVRLPRWLTPGALTVKHIDLDGEQFVFTLSVVHPRAGALIEQSVMFHEAM